SREACINVFRWRLLACLILIESPSTEILARSLHDALPILAHRENGRSWQGLPPATRARRDGDGYLLGGQKIAVCDAPVADALLRSEEHTSELQSRENLVCRPLPEKKKNRCK